MPTYYIGNMPFSSDLYHSGVKGQKWGVRRYQNPDGTLTALGKAHYSIGKAGRATGKAAAKLGKKVGSAIKSGVKHTKESIKSSAAAKKALRKEKKQWEKDWNPRNIRKWENDELKSRDMRLKMEIEYKRDWANLHPDSIRKKEAARKVKETIGKASGEFIINFTKTLGTTLGKLGTDDKDKGKKNKKKDDDNIDKMTGFVNSLSGLISASGGNNGGGSNERERTLKDSFKDWNARRKVKEYKTQKSMRQTRTWLENELPKVNFDDED